MPACDVGRCCIGSLCSEDKKCCCQAKGGTFAIGETCRTVACQNGAACTYQPVCDCLASGGTITGSCAPCDGVVCNKCEQCIDGSCVSTCHSCQQCDTTSINGTCVPKACSPACGACQQCVCSAGVTSCETLGYPCPQPNGPACCNALQCCVDGACLACDCSDVVKPGPCWGCAGGVYTPVNGRECGQNCCVESQECCNGTCCPNGQRCCGTTCQQCCNNTHCAAGQVCSSGVCKTPQCCIEVPACAPQSITNRTPCVGYTGSDGSGNPCEVVAIPVGCSSSQCAYEWSGAAWSFLGCAIITSQGRVIVAGAQGGCGCTADGCAAANTLPPGSAAGDVLYSGLCADAVSGLSFSANPLP